MWQMFDKREDKVNIARAQGQNMRGIVRNWLIYSYSSFESSSSHFQWTLEIVLYEAGFVTFSKVQKNSEIF